MKESAIIGNAYKKAKKTIRIDGTMYYLYAALSRTSKNFKHLIPYNEKHSSIKVFVDLKSDVCPVYGTLRIKKLISKQIMK